METFVISVPEKKSALVKQLLKELGVTINAAAETKSIDKTPNKLTVKTIHDAQKGIGLGGPIQNIADFVNSL